MAKTHETFRVYSLQFSKTSHTDLFDNILIDNANKDLLCNLEDFVLYQIIMKFIDNKLDMIEWNNIKESVNKYIITHQVTLTFH